MERIKTLVIIILMAIICGSAVNPHKDTPKYFDDNTVISTICLRNVTYLVVRTTRTDRIQALGVTVMTDKFGLPIHCIPGAPNGKQP